MHDVYQYLKCKNAFGGDQLKSISNENGFLLCEIKSFSTHLEVRRSLPIV